MDDFIPSEDLSGVEQLKRSAAIATQNVARLRHQLENEPDEFTRSRLLKLLLLEAERSRLTCQQLDRVDCHMAELRELTYRQVELVEKSNLKGQIIEPKLVSRLVNENANFCSFLRRICNAHSSCIHAFWDWSAKATLRQRYWTNRPRRCCCWMRRAAFC